MDLLLVLLATATFPVACLGFVLWMGRLEDSIPGAVRRAARAPDPPPVLAIPVRRPVSAIVAIPAQRSDEPPVPGVPVAALAGAPAGAPAGSPRRRAAAVRSAQRLEGSRSDELSLGGSTNR